MRQLFLAFVFTLIIIRLDAQNTMYFMDRLPQNIGYNPAFMPKMDFYIGLPGIGGVSSQVYNSGFTMNEMNDFIDNLENPNYNPDEFVKKIGEYNSFTGEASANLMSFGFRIRDKNYLSMSITGNTLVIKKAKSDIAYLIADLDNLNPEDFPVVVDDIYLNGNSYISMGITYSRKINDNLTLGITPKINFNQAGINTTGLYYRVDLNTNPVTQEDVYDETFNGEVQVGLPTEINPEAINNGELVFDAGLLPEGWEEDITLSRMLKDKSLMIDLGAAYQIDKWTLSASVLNLGNSVFKTDAYNFDGNSNKVMVKETEKVTIGIPTKLYIGAMHQFSPKWNYGVLFNENFYSVKAVPTATASLNGYVGKYLSSSVSYTVGYKHSNLGLGFRLRFLPGVDLFAVTDNLIQAFNYKNAYRITAAAGINIAIGVGDEFKKNEIPEGIPVDNQ